MKVLITGSAGFIGGFLVKQCLEAGSAVQGIDICEPESDWAGASFERCDIRDFGRLLELISGFRPELIFHLAAQSYPTVSLARPRETMDINAGGTINLFECLCTLGIKPIVIVACSSAEYGRVADEDLPVREDHALRPLHPYGVSKVAQDLLAAQYFENFSIPAIRIRIFKTSGPGKLGDVCSDLAKRTVEIEMGIRPPTMEVGNLTTRRTIVDVRDLVQALWLAAEHCKPGEVYNVGGDDIYSVQELIEFIRAQSTSHFDIEQRPELMRLCDEAIVAGDNTKFRNCCSWTPKIRITTTLSETVDWWRNRLAGSAPPREQQATARVWNLHRMNQAHPRNERISTLEG
jgi:GDP-4-dehydro-6-deoxy-D-mannose reductase